MKISKILLFSLIVLISCYIPTESFAESKECTKATLAAIEKDKDKHAETNAKASVDAAVAYNNVAKEYIANCNNKIAKGTPTKYSKRLNKLAMRALKDPSYQANFVDPNLYENTGINWNAEHPTTPDCQNLLAKAKSLHKNFISQYNKTANFLGFYGNDKNVPTTCICDGGNAEEAQCATYATETMEEKDESKEKCSAFTEYLAEIAGCPLCPIFSVILSADASLASIAWDALAKSLQTVVLTFGAVYIAMETLKNVSNMTGAGISGYLRSIFTIGLKVYITYLLLDNSAYIYNLFISPTLKGGLDMGLALLSIGDPGIGSCINSGTSTVTGGSGELDASLLGSIYKTIECFGNSAAIMPAVGRGLICYGWENEGNAIPEFEMWFVGLILYIFGLAIWLVISFYLIDCTVQLGIVCAIIPILIACWPFKITQRYSTKGVTLLMNTFFNYALMGIIILFGSKIVGFASTGKSGDFSSYVAAINSNDIEVLKKLASLDGLEILTLVSCCIFAFKLIGISGTIANKFAHSAGTNIAPFIGGAAASAVTAIGKGAGHTGLKIAGAGASKLADVTGVSKAASKVSGAIGSAALSGASMAGKAVGLGRFQPKTSQYVPSNQGGAGATANQTNPNTPANGENPEISNTQTDDRQQPYDYMNNQHGRNRDRYGTHRKKRRKTPNVTLRDVMNDRNRQSSSNNNPDSSE